MSLHPRPLAAALLALAGLTLPAVAQHEVADPATIIEPASQKPPVNPDDVALYQRIVGTLAGPEYAGRLTGTSENLRAAAYLQAWFTAAGLEPAFKDETGTPSFTQPFTAGTMVRALAASVDIEAAPSRQRAELGNGLEILSNSGSGTVSGPLVFVGYSITDGPDGYSSYPPDTDLSGKLAVLLRFEPMDAQGRSRWSQEGAGSWSPAANLEAKVRAAAERKAAGVVVVNPPGADDPRTGRPETFGSLRLGRPLEVPVVMLAEEVLEAALAPAGPSLSELRAWADENPGVRPLDLSARLDVTVERVPRESVNVGAILPGRGELADEYVVLGAHFDHVGDGSAGGAREEFIGQVHPGADDNASGTAGLLLAARALARDAAAMADDQPRRSILFLGFSGEELGLFGSRHFVRESPVPAASIYAMLNMDMIGRLRDDPPLEVGGVGTAEGFADWLRPRFEAAGIRISPKPGGMGPSDHASFYSAQIPVLFFFTSYHKEYHTPADTADLINAEGGVRVSALATTITRDLATRDGALVYAPPKIDAGAPAPQGGVRGARVRFGIAPGSYSEDEVGVPVGDVYPGTSAAEAGIKAGDRLMAWNGAPIDGVEGWMRQLARHKVGDEVKVTVRRDGQDLELTVKLKGRETGAR
ncbi:MAG TPA: M28 family peptidase [Phycisphaerales bacterium]|nr:M28 family peptidase [Phycisphaerales bacterium]